uniref:Uncharacterized protein n=1 Tax=Romanomermis culicivorax TaxID=13658 RepID=A0A915J304_ROMCU
MLLPWSNDKLFKKFQIQDCTPYANEPRCDKGINYSGTEISIFPARIGLVQYNAEKTPFACAIPTKYPDAPPTTLLTFGKAQTLLNAKNNEDEDVDDGYPVEASGSRKEDDIADYTPVKHYRRNYMAGVLRLHQAGHLRNKYHEPGMYYWSNLRRNNSIQDILQAIKFLLISLGPHRCPWCSYQCNAQILMTLYLILKNGMRWFTVHEDD